MLSNIRTHLLLTSLSIAPYDVSVRLDLLHEIKQPLNAYLTYDVDRLKCPNYIEFSV